MLVIMANNTLASDFSFFKSCILSKVFIYQAFVLCCQLFLLMVWPDSHLASVLSLLMGITSALFLPLLIVLSNRYRLLLLTFVGFSLAPVWFLYLDGVLPVGLSYSMSTPVSKQLVSVYTSSFFTAFIFFYRIPVSTRLVSLFPKPSFPSFSQKFFSILSIFSFVFPILIIGFFQHGGSWDAIAYSLTAGRDGSASGLLLRSDGFAGSVFNIMLPLVWLFMFTPSLCALSLNHNLLSTKLLALRFISLLCAASVILFVWLSGERSSFILTLVPALSILCSRFLVNKKKFFILVFILPFLLSTLLNANQIQVRYRGNILDKVQSQASFSEDLQDQFIDDSLYIASLVVEKVPDQSPFLGYDKLIEPLILIVPRFIWLSKPIPHSDPSLFNLFNSGVITFGTPSLTLSIIGTLYLFAGFPTIMLGAPLFSFIFLYLDRVHFNVLKQSSPVSLLTMALAFPASIYSFRAYAAIINVMLPVFLIFIIAILLKYFSQPTRRHRMNCR